MSDQRDGGIAWTEQTWNPLRGCTRVSAGCVNCYAESMAARFCGSGQPYEGTINPDTKRWNGSIKLVPEHLQDPLRWKRPRMVFVNSMSDLFHEDVPDEFIDQVFAVMALAPQHTFQVLTKRPERMREYFEHHFTRSKCGRLAGDITGRRDDCAGTGDVLVSNMQFPLPNVWLGVTVENQEAADERIPLLLQTPAEVRWVSMEPLLGAVDLRQVMAKQGDSDWIFRYDALTGFRGHKCGGTENNPRLDWVVVGGESGPNARPMHPDWARSLRDQCADAGVPFLFKQWGEFGTIYENGSSGLPVFKAFPDFQTWVNKASTWVRGGICLGTDGRELRNGGDMMRARDEGKFPVTIMHRVGKKAAGRLLDGVLHDGYPEAKK